MGCNPLDPTSVGDLFGGSSGGGNPAPSTPTIHPTQPAFGGVTPGGQGGNLGICGNGQPATFGGATPGGGTSGIQQPGLSGNQLDPNGGMNSGISQLCGSTNEVIPQNINYNDPLGPNQSGAEAPSGGPEMRAGIYNTIQQLYPGLGVNTQNSVNALRAAAANPGYADAAQLARDEINGKYLNGSPQLDAAINDTRTNAMREAQDQNARLRGQFEQNGMAFGTPQQQAQEASQGLQSSNANQAADAMRLANYQTERQNQDTAVNRLDQATGSPVNYLSQVNASELSPLSSIAQMVAGLSGGSSTSYQPQDIVNNQGYLRQLTSTVGSL